MQEGSKGIDLEFFQTNSEWEMIDSTATVQEESDEASVIYTLKIQRKPRYMILSVILPIVMLSALNLFVFILPCDSGEKASYAVTVFLAFAVFMTIVSSTLPTNSETLSIFSVYIIILTVQSTLITMTALFILRLRQFESPVPYTVSRLADIMLCQCSKKCGKVEPEELRHKSDTEIPQSKGFRENAMGKTTTENNKDIHCDWKRVANALDRFFLLFFLFITFVSSFICFTYASSAQKT